MKKNWTKWNNLNVDEKQQKIDVEYEKYKAYFKKLEKKNFIAEGQEMWDKSTFGRKYSAVADNKRSITGFTGDLIAEAVHTNVPKDRITQMKKSIDSPAATASMVNIMANNNFSDDVRYENYEVTENNKVRFSMIHQRYGHDNLPYQADIEIDLNWSNKQYTDYLRTKPKWVTVQLLIETLGRQEGLEAFGYVD